MDIILINGYPRTGKTTVAANLSEKLKLPIIHTHDYYVGLPWEDIPEKIISAAKELNGNVIIEGMQCGRIARLILRNEIYSDIKIIRFYHLTNPLEPLKSKQISIAKSLNTIFFDIEKELNGSKIDVRYNFE
jgi:dephospho-CoA kinase